MIFFPLKDVWQCLGTFLNVITGKGRSSGKRPERDTSEHPILYTQSPAVNIHTAQTIGGIQAAKPFSRVIWVGLKLFPCQRTPYGKQQELSVCQGWLKGFLTFFFFLLFSIPQQSSEVAHKTPLVRLCGGVDYSKPCHRHEKGTACETSSSLSPQAQHGRGTLWF